MSLTSLCQKIEGYLIFIACHVIDLIHVPENNDSVVKLFYNQLLYTDKEKSFPLFLLVGIRYIKSDIVTKRVIY